MNRQEIVELAQKYIMAAQELDNAGLTTEASKIDSDILNAIDEGILPIKLKVIKTASKNTKLAIRGQSDLNEYLESAVTGAGVGVGGALGSGAWIAALPSAAAGAGVGVAGQAIGDWAFNNLQGQTSKLESLGNDLVNLSNSIGQTVSQFDPGAAQQIIQLATGLQQRIMAVREQKRLEISKKVGLDPNQGFMQSINPMNWGKVLNRTKQMVQATKQKAMIKIADTRTNPLDVAALVSDPSDIPRNNVLKQMKAQNPLAFKGLSGVARGALTGGGALVGGYAANKGYNTLRNKLVGAEGILRKQISDINQIGASLAQISQDPAVMQITQQIAQAAQGALYGLMQKDPHQQQIPLGGQTPIQPAQYFEANQTFR